ncbi:glycosyltransferase family 4 protein [Patescibacteria group bacterium]|nr:glycosyltransferase family 4 protein [Patescibacteria group bacterium]
MENKKLKVLYIFSKETKPLEEMWKAGEMPDTYLLGLNHLKDFDVDAEYIETDYINKWRKYNVNLSAFPLFFKIRKYDVVFSEGSLFFPFIYKFILRFKKPKFVWYNTFFTNIIKKNSGFKRDLIVETIKSLDGIACPSKIQHDFLLEWGVKPEKLFLVSNGVDVDFIQKEQAKMDLEEENGGEDYILSVGTEGKRDYNTLIEAVKKLNLKVKIVAMPRKLKNENRVSSHFVDFTGPVPFNKLLKYYKDAKFVVIPTKNEDTLDVSDCLGQYVLLDSIASGKPVIASKRMSLDDYVQDKKDVVLVDPENSEDLQSAIELLINSPELVKTLQKNMDVKSMKFTTENFARQLAVIFKKVIY